MVYESVVDEASGGIGFVLVLFPCFIQTHGGYHPSAARLLLLLHFPAGCKARSDISPTLRHVCLCLFLPPTRLFAIAHITCPRL